MEHAACRGRKGQQPQQQQHGQQQQHESRSSRNSHRRICRHSDSNVRRRMTFYSNQFVQTETMFLRVSFFQSRIMISGPELMTLTCPVLRQTNWLRKSPPPSSFQIHILKYTADAVWNRHPSGHPTWHDVTGRDMT